MDSRRYPQVFKYHKVTIERLEKFISSIYFTDVNIYGKIYPKDDSVDIPKIACYSVPDLKQMDFEEAINQKFEPTKVGESFGPSWSTHWFCLELEIPERFEGKEVHLLWDCNAESMLYSEDGVALQSFTGTNEHFKRHDFILTRNHVPEKTAQKRIYYVELACNGLFGCGNNGFINPPDPKKSFSLSKAKVAVFDRLAYDLYQDMKLLYNISKELKEKDKNRSLKAMTVGNDIVNLFRENDRETWKDCLALSRKFFEKNISEAAHKVYACGHSHLDVAWLWPYLETERKAGRTFVTQCLLMDDYPNDFLFAQPQAVLYDWVKRRYPKIFERVCENVVKKKWIPVGGTWVEFDGNIPGGESMCRQFLYGQSFFRKEFGKTCEIFWLPDTFGYSTNLPQIMKLSGCNYFLTQKLSWNLINKFPHSTFYWEGLDGTAVLSHFPPCDTYCAEFKVDEMVRQVNNFKDSDKSNRSVLLFGHGDGAGGPKREHVDLYLRYKKGIVGFPEVKMCDPVQFFKDVEEDESKKKRLNVWSGELYFELHRGTYTTQATTKKNNRHCELLLRDIEFLSSMMMMCDKKKKVEYPSKTIEKCWKNVLLNQFHDVLPGSSIECVYRDADRLYDEVYKECKKIKDTFFECMTKKEEGKSVIINTLNFERDCVIDLRAHKKQEEDEEEGEEEELKLVRYKVPGMSAITIDHDELLKKKKKDEDDRIVKIVCNTEEKLELENPFIKLVIHKTKEKRYRMDVIDKESGNVIVEEGNRFYLFDDVPLFWDAWDAMIYHLEKFDECDRSEESSLKILEEHPLRIRIKLPRLRISDVSWLEQVLEVDAVSSLIRFETTVEWRENRKFLKVGFPTNIRSNRATYDVQFGHLIRSTEKNTSWDYAKCEVSCQKWFDLSEYGMGMSILNESKYGCAIWRGNEMLISLLRSPKAPDENCDMGRHFFKYALYPHTRSIQEDAVPQKGYEFSVPLIQRVGRSLVEDEKNWISVSSDQVVVEAVKRSEDGKGMVIRLYESFGGKANVVLKVRMKVKEVLECNILEDEMGKFENFSTQDDCTELPLQFSNFQIRSILLIP